jgi:hypothetical protein
VPAIQSLINADRLPEQLDVYAVSTAYRSDADAPEPEAWLGGEGFTPQVIGDDADSSAYFAFGGSGFPYAVYVNGDGEIVARTAGSLDEDAMVNLWSITADS